MRYLARALGTVAVVGGIGGNVTAQVTLDTGGPARQIGMFTNDPSYGAHHSAGQTFVTPSSASVLDGFTFWLNAHGDTDLFDPNVIFAGYVMRWDAANERAVGPVLWESGRRVGPTRMMQQYDFATGGLALNPNDTYIAFLSMSEYFGEMTGQRGALMGYNYESYDQGRFYSQTTGAEPSNWTNAGWVSDGGCASCDAAFVARFSTASDLSTSVTPEPASMVLLGTGLAGLGAAGRRRKRRSAEDAQLDSLPS